MKRIILGLILFLVFAPCAWAQNVTDQNPLILDTAGEITTTIKYVTQAIWHKCGTNEQELVIRDVNGGDVIGYGVCVAGSSVKIWDGDVCPQDIYLDQIDSGELHIMISEPRSRRPECEKFGAPILP